MNMLPVGKLPPKLLADLLTDHTPEDPRVFLGPGLGLDCAVLEMGDVFLIAKTDPITFATEDIGWYAVNVNANDIATTGAIPKWFMATILLPENATKAPMAERVFNQIKEACRTINADLIGGHTEITHGLDRIIVVGTMLGEVKRERLITPKGANPDDRVLMTKGIPIEATSILSRDFHAQLSSLPPTTISTAQDFLHNPGISVLKEAQAAVETGAVTAMHDPTEGGILGGVWELAQASANGIEIEKSAIHIPEEALAICNELDVDPYTAIASGALLLTVPPASVIEVKEAIDSIGVEVFEIGRITEGNEVLMIEGDDQSVIEPPARDAIAELYETHSDQELSTPHNEF